LASTAVTKLAASASRLPAHMAWFAMSAAVLATVLCIRVDARAAESDTVPADIQVDLISKLASYDRSFASRAGDTARVLVVVKRDRPKSEVSAAEVKSALARVDRIGGLPHVDTVVPYEGGARLAALCKAQRASVVYLTRGFDDDIGEVRAALSEISVLSVAAVPDYVPQGIVLGFELDSGKPRMLLNLDQARRQDVRFPSEVLRLMKVYQ
jgi:hypothetical protein